MPAPETEPSRPSILLVDDERPYLEMLRTGLNKEFEIQLAFNTEDAEMRMNLRDYDIVVSDHLMPGEKGLDFLVRACEQHPKTRRILMTGYINPQLLSRSIGVAKLARCILKPLGVADLAKVLREVMAAPATDTAPASDPTTDAS
jgi:DNA-binding NtrC family response regulator